MKRIALDLIDYQGQPTVHTTIVDADGRLIYDELYNSFDTAVAMLRVVWQRFGDETKPGEEFYGTPAKGNSR